MRTLARKWYLPLLYILVIGCEDVVDIKLENEAPRLIVDALVRIDMAQPTTLISIKVSLSDGFYGITPLTKLENIIIFVDKIENGSVSQSYSIPFENIENSFGVYEKIISTETFLEPNRYLLVIRHDEKVYAAESFFSPAPPIDSIVQGEQTLFTKDETEVIISYNDITDQNNFYVFDFGFNDYVTSEDQFYKNQAYSFSYYYDRNIPSNTSLDISILGADREFYNYINLLNEQTESALGIFETPQTTVRGNVFDITEIDNIDVFDNVERPEEFALGYFAFVQENKISIQIK